MPPNNPFEHVQAVVWSQQRCAACEQAKQLLAQHNIGYRVENLDSEAQKQIFYTVFPTARSVPQIVVDNVWIGGLSDLKRFINDKLKTFKVV